MMVLSSPTSYCAAAFKLFKVCQNLEKVLLSTRRDSEGENHLVDQQKSRVPIEITTTATVAKIGI